MNPLCIYHGNCADGFGAAWVFHKRFGSDIDFHPGDYKSAPPAGTTGRKLFLTDFSYKRPVVEELLAAGTDITLIDHHKTALEDLDGVVGQTYCSIDRSGAMLAWEFCFPGEKPPELLRYIQDRDLWKWALPESREVSAALFSYPYDFAVWEKLMARPINELAVEGAGILRKQDKDIRELLGVVQRRMTIGGYNVPVANMPYMHVSDAAHIMAQGEAFAACYWDTPTGRTFGLRSSPTGMDVQQVAKQYGGGGHVHAAGFTVPYDVADTFELEGFRPAKAPADNGRLPPLELAAQAWCTPETQALVMDEKLARAFASIIDSDRVLGTVPKAFDVLKRALQDDPDYAWSWHCNVAMVAQDAGAPAFESNQRAATFMRNAFDINTRSTPQWQSWMRQHEASKSIECHGLDTPDRICFYEQDFYPLSNFSAFSLHWAGDFFPTSEHAYQWEKFRTVAPDIADQVHFAPSAHVAFKIAEEHRAMVRSDWGDVKVDTMRQILRAKVAQHEYVMRKLLATGERELVENSWRDSYWGWGADRAGRNMLGRLWMEIRTELRKVQHEAEVTEA